MDRLKSSPRLMIVSDLDHTMVDHHDPENSSLFRFNALWEAHYRNDSLLVFSTGRSPTLYKQLRKEKPMITPDIAIMSVGTEITYGKSMVPDDGWVQFLNQKWDKKIVIEETSKFPELKPQAETEQRPHKVSFYVEKDKAKKVTEALSKILQGRGLDVKIIYSGGIDLDILPKGAGKGQALAYLLKKFETEGKPPVNTLVCGDSGNDAELFSIPGVYGVMVSNAQEELLQWHAENAKDNPKILHASERCASGIIQAIGHFNLGPNLSPRDVSDVGQEHVKNASPGLEVVNFSLLLEKWRRAEIENSELFIAGIKASALPSGVYIHPSGSDHNIREYANIFRKVYGDKQGKQFRMWVDDVLATQLSSDTWLIKFDKWESSGEERRGCVVTTILSKKDSEWFTLVHVHQTWLQQPGQDEWLL
ncbi:sucrose-phosphatase 1-like [Abrus precatorius]|uniref:Sucrose-phosphatase n=1 Tax=Abrus precatorius TaxID=3816 RepID=A0A8B8M504_ABRPR|nr:sucrose-phosphatase 1-like [Abrus precatorius]XP_027363602.1 sucrose-phosphatase 1-like [Abrus precatorius]XP_027363603.1 sucrose-phosphatase 1-like [Abrus precatorius]XP_027363604.1 sucrose-phosphatase 1-like [Abrus precatorius]XP_027363605.1 sucrose-phosphatase 1-like [Abrus precatorius]